MTSVKINKDKVTKLFGNKEEIAYIFGVNIKTLSNDLTQMRRLPQFAGYVMNISHKRVFISIEGYRAYLEYKAQNKNH
ncbi:DNA-binding protein [Lactovum odontotermitis]